jgi:hypothetical protein
MITGPACPTHGDLALRLALGELDDAAAGRAGELTAGCPVCRAWWDRSLAVEAVSAGVAAGLDDLRARLARRPAGVRRGLGVRGAVTAMAAGLLLLLGGSLAWRLTGPGADGARGVDGANGTTASPAAAVADLAAPPAAEGATLFADGLESGDLGAWTAASSRH